MVFDAPLSPLELLLRLAAAACLTGVLGLEREYQAKPAGLRTHMLVGLGAACFSLAALGLARAVEVDDLTAGARTIVDPTRIVEGVVGGIGFLGAGAILRTRGSVEGLTTAGSIWLAGAVGIAAGSGNYVLAVLATLLALVILALLGWVESRLIHQSPARQEPHDSTDA